MIDPKGLVAWLAATVLSTTLIAAPEPVPPGGRASGEEPFHSFRILDSKITLLAHQQESLKAAFNAMQTGSRTMAAKSRQRKVARSMNFTAAEIRRTAAGLERLYRTRHQPFGVQIFRALSIRAEELQRGVNALTSAQTRAATDLAANSLDKKIVSLVVQFQAASGGYGAVRCSPGAWTCCEPKRSKDLLQSEAVACVWKCVRTPQTCTGFLGPRANLRRHPQKERELSRLKSRRCGQRPRCCQKTTKPTMIITSRHLLVRVHHSATDHSGSDATATRW
jgi:hypothetical protein